MHLLHIPSIIRIFTASEANISTSILEDLVVSDSLSCSFCNTIFEDQAQQRLHYKLDWHRYNLKQRLYGLKLITEDEFSLLADKGIQMNSNENLSSLFKKYLNSFIHWNFIYR